VHGIWRAAIAALLGHALTAPGVDDSARVVALVAAIVVAVVWPGRGMLVLVLLAGAIGGIRLQHHVEIASRWEDASRVRVRMEVLEVRRSSVRVLAAAPGLPAVQAWVSGVDGARPGEFWEGILQTFPLVATRNPDDRDAVRNGLSSGAVLRARMIEDPRRVDAREPEWNQRARDAAHARWAERWGEGAGLWSALLLADRRGLDDDARSRLQLQGLAHLLALSGLHVGIVAGVMLWPWRKRGPRIWVAAVPVLLVWAVLAGGGASMMRAVGMVAWIAAARLRGLGSRPLDALAAVALLETVLRPEVVCGVGWWLSYTATAAILRILPWLAGRPWWQSALLVSFAAQTATAAWTLDAFGRLPWAAPAVQLVVGPAFTLVLAVGGVAAVVALGTGPIASAAAGVSALLAHGFGALVGVFTTSGRLALHHPGWDGLDWALVLALTALLLVPLRWTRRSLRVTTASAIVALVLVHVPSLLDALQGTSHRWVSLDVGQGDGGIYLCPRRVMVIDAGPYSPGLLPVDRVMIPYLERRGVGDASLVLTHGHLDHTAGTHRLLGSGRIGSLGMAAVDSTSEWAIELAVRAADEGVGVRWLAAGDTLWSDCCEAICLWPTEPTTFEHANDRSVVLRLGPRSTPLLTTGDLEHHAEEEVLALLERDHAVGVRRWSLKVAHHGGNTGTQEAWLRWLAPVYALISCGHGNRYGHPHPHLLQRLHDCGAELARTDLQGAIELRWTDANEVPVLVLHGRRPSSAAPVDALLRRTYAALAASP
jgi:competence protein ComEC